MQLLAKNSKSHITEAVAIQLQIGMQLPRRLLHMDKLTLTADHQGLEVPSALSTSAMTTVICL